MFNSLVCTPSSLNKFFGLRQDVKKQQAAIFLSFAALSGEDKITTENFISYALEGKIL